MNVTGRCKDFSGKVFKNLTIIEFAGRENNITYWKCRCSCGNLFIKSLDYISDDSKGCKDCVQKHLDKIHKVHEFIGRKFGQLTVIERISTGKGSIYLCKCSCGKERRVRPTALKNNDVEACVTCIREKNKKQTLAKKEAAKKERAAKREATRQKRRAEKEAEKVRKQILLEKAVEEANRSSHCCPECGLIKDADDFNKVTQYSINRRRVCLICIQKNQEESKKLTKENNLKLDVIKCRTCNNLYAPPFFSYLAQKNPECKFCSKEKRDKRKIENLKKEKYTCYDCGCEFSDILDSQLYLTAQRCNNCVRKKRERIRNNKNEMTKIKESLRGLVRRSLVRVDFEKTQKTTTILGCSIDELVEHLESQFKEGMGWHNRDEWHIDHVIPISRAKNINEAISLNHYTNLQPLWAVENIMKGDG